MKYIIIFLLIFNCFDHTINPTGILNLTLQKKPEYSIPSLENLLKRYDSQDAKLIRDYVYQHWRITKGDYKKFAIWVRDSITHHLIGGNHLKELKRGGSIVINWKRKIKWNNKEVKADTKDMLWKDAIIKDYGNMNAYSNNTENIMPIINLSVLTFDFACAENGTLIYKYYYDNEKWLNKYGNWKPKSVNLFDRSYSEFYEYDINGSPVKYEYELLRKKYDHFWSTKGDEDLINISYEKAIAYYVWRNIRFLKSTKSKKHYLVNLITPSSEEWQMIIAKKGEVSKTKCSKIYKLVQDIFHIE